MCGGGGYLWPSSDRVISHLAPVLFLCCTRLLQYVVVRCGMLRYVAVCCSMMQYVAVWRCMVQYVKWAISDLIPVLSLCCAQLLQYIVVCCRVLHGQYDPCTVALMHSIAVCCSMRQYAAACGSVLHWQYAI